MNNQTLQLPQSQVKAKRLLEQERASEIKALVSSTVEDLSFVLLGERLPLDIVRGTGQVLIPQKRLVTKTNLRSVVEAYPEIDIETGPVRVALMSKLAPYGEKLAEIKARYARRFEELAS